MGLIRKAVIVGGLLLALPSPPHEAGNGQQVSTFAALSAATATFADAKGFCGRQPEACATGQVIATVLEEKAKYTARIIMSWANANGANGTNGEQVAQKPAAPAPNLRLATLNEPPKSINDLLRGTQ